MRRFPAGLVTGIAITCTFLVVIGHVLDVEAPLRPADVIVALSGDTGARTETAIDRWKRKLAPIIISAGASEDPTSVASGQLLVELAKLSAEVASTAFENRSASFFHSR
jgi:hypothetical protein